MITLGGWAAANIVSGFIIAGTVQGGFLLLMDGVMIMLHGNNTFRMNKKLRQFDLNAGPGGLGISYRL